MDVFIYLLMRRMSITYVWLLLANLLATTRRENSPTRIGLGVSLPGFFRCTCLESRIHRLGVGRIPSSPTSPDLAMALKSRFVLARFFDQKKNCPHVLRLGAGRPCPR